MDRIYSRWGPFVDYVDDDAREVLVCLQELNIAEILHSITLHSVMRVRDEEECVMEWNVTEWMRDGAVML